MTLEKLISEFEKKRQFNLDVAALNIEVKHSNWYLGPKVRKFIKLSLEYATECFTEERNSALALIEALKKENESLKRMFDDVKEENKKLYIDRGILEIKIDKLKEQLTRMKENNPTRNEEER